jgi:hypothetical protein
VRGRGGERSSNAGDEDNYKSSEKSSDKNNDKTNDKNNGRKSSSNNNKSNNKNNNHNNSSISGYNSNKSIYRNVIGTAPSAPNPLPSLSSATGSPTMNVRSSQLLMVISNTGIDALALSLFCF